MMKVKLFGMGAAGNKAAITAVELGVISLENTVLINSTETDIPDAFKNASIIIGENNGAGKESDLGYLMMDGAIKSGDMVEFLQSFLSEDTDAVVITAATEGGTGNGSTKRLAEFIQEEVGIPVHVHLFSGFEDDSRGLENTIKLFNSIRPEYTVKCISNAKCLTSGNKIKAEKEANIEFCKALKVISGATMISSSQNIDQTDLLKLVNTPAYQLVETATIGKDVKTTEQFDKLLVSMINNSKSVDTTKGTCKRIGVILSINPDLQDIIDFSFKAVKDIVGEPYELFTHIQPSEDVQSVSLIISGMNLPKDEFEDVLQKYKERTSKVHREEDPFFSNRVNLEDDGMFNSATSNNVKKSFFQKQVKPASGMKNLKGEIKEV